MSSAISSLHRVGSLWLPTPLAHQSSDHQKYITLHQEDILLIRRVFESQKVVLQHKHPLYKSSVETCSSSSTGILKSSKSRTNA